MQTRRASALCTLATLAVFEVLTSMTLCGGHEALAIRAVNLGAGTVAPPPPPGPPAPPFGINLVLATGQSLSTGATATPTSTTQPYSNVMLQDALVTWAATTAYGAHAWVSPGTKFAYTTASGCTSGSGPTWSTTIGGNTTDGSCTWTTDHALADDIPTLNDPWVSGGSYTANYDSNTFLHPHNQPCIHIRTGGTAPSGSVEPAWVSTIGVADPADGSYTWKCFFPLYGWFDMTNATSPSLSLVPFIEPVRSLAWASMYPHNAQGESPTAATINGVTAISMAAGESPGWVMAGSDTGMGGQGLTVIQKGGLGNNYAAGLYEARAMKALAAAQSKTFGVVAIILTHGEADWQTAGYGAGVVTLAQNYQTDLQAITGQSRAIPMIASQQSTTPCMPTPWSTVDLPYSAYQLLSAHNTSSGAVVLSGPKYALPRNNNDQHMPAAGYRELGEKYAEVIWTLANGQAWHPLQPTSFAYNSGTNQVTIALDVQFPPLVVDTTTVPLNHQSAYTEWASGDGLEAWDSVGHITISSVTISGANLIVQLSGTVHTGLTIAYASTSDATVATSGCYGGQPGGHYGNIRDSDPFIGPITGVAQRNWLVIFESSTLT